MRNRMYGGVRGRKTKVGKKLLRFPPTRFLSDESLSSVSSFHRYFFYRPAIKIFSYRDKLPRSLLPTASPNLYLVKYKSHQMKYSLYLTKYR